MSKLKNVETIQKMLNGTSRWQTRKSFGFSDINAVKEQTKERIDGEIWEERTGPESSVWWRMENGMRVKYNVHPNTADLLRKVRLDSKKFWNCPKDICTCTNPKPIDERLRVKTGMCEDCLISHETKLKIQGKFKEYALNKMKSNAESFFKQADGEVEFIKNELSNTVSFVDANGDSEVWNVEGKEKLLNRIDSDYQKFKEMVMEKFEREAPGETQAVKE